MWWCCGAVGLFKAITFGVLQGLTEFLPVSSSGHLVLAQELFPEGVPHGLAFDVVLHFGTLVAVVGYFWRDLRDMMWAVLGRGKRSSEPYLGRWVWLLGLGTVPIVFVGGLFAPIIEQAFSSVSTVAVGWIITSLLLFYAHYRPPGHKGRAEVGVADALLIGLFQAVAIVPGISRSGSTITGALARGIERDTAARFAFLLSLPAIAGAMLRSYRELGALVEQDPTAALAGTVAACVTGWLAIEITMRAVRSGRLLPFALYCSVLGVVALTVAVL